jgi:hypothetical protein
MLPNFYRNFLQLKPKIRKYLMTKLSLKPSKPCVPDPYTIIWSESGRRQSQNFMRTSSNSANRMSCTSANSSYKEKHPSTMKLQDQLITMTTTSAGTPSKYTTSIPTIVSLRKTEKRILSHPRKKGVRGPSTTSQTNTTREGAC